MLWLWTWLGLGMVIGAIWLVAVKARSAGQARERQLWISIARDISHQYATPLSALMGWVDVLPSLKSLEAALPEMNRDLERLKLICERLGQVGAPTRFQTVDLGQIIGDVRAYFQKRLPAGDQGIEILEEISGTPAAQANQDLLQWALEHLVRNAADSIQGRGRIILRAHREGNRAILEVEDSGRGIERFHRRRIFHPGFTTKVGGRGSGLALVRLIVEENHQGRFMLKQTQPGKGATFRIVLKATGSE